MSTRSSSAPRKVSYPTSDGEPVAETDDHRGVMFDTITSLTWFFRDDPAVYVSGNLLLFYVEGDRRRHVSPDVFVVRGVPKHRRDNYLLWEEGRGPACVIELTSPSTRSEDTAKKYELYRDTLRVPEYFLFDPKSQYLEPRLQGHRLVEGAYVPIEPVQGRLPSAGLGLHLEGVGTDLRLYNPTTGLWLPTPSEAEAARQQAEAARQQAEARTDQLQRELDELRRRLGERG